MSAKFELIDAQKADFPIVKMCEWAKVSTSGYYEWRDRPASATAIRREHLKSLVAAIFKHSDQTYGYRRVHKPRDGGYLISSPSIINIAIQLQMMLICSTEQPVV